MTKLKTLSLLLILTILVFSCDWIFKPGPCDASGPVIVYKTKGDYHDKLSIQLSNDKRKVTCYPGKADAEHQKPVQLANGYLLKRMCGNAFLSISIDEYVNSSQNYSSGDLLNLVIDSDPYTEKYECCECTQGDTATINQLIRENLLSKCDNLK